jgi:hypothetical protein
MDRSDARGIHRAALDTLLADPTAAGKNQSRPTEARPNGHYRVASDTQLKSPEWPTLHEEAFYGLAGDIVRTIDPHTEADPAALLSQLLIGFGNLIGCGPYYRAGADMHHTNLFGVLVGQTSRGRKGSSWSVIAELLRQADPEWSDSRVAMGLSSGEGLIFAVRDAIEEQEALREPKTKKITGYQLVRTDPGVSDKRLLVHEAEFASVLRVTEREGNTLSPVMRQAWDTGSLRILTRNKPVKATGAHISIIGHITRDELLKYLTSSEAGNGFANRFLWICTKRSKLLPDGGLLNTIDMAPFIRRLSDAVDFARVAGELRRDGEAAELWRDVYEQLTGGLVGNTGLFGAVTSRSEAQTLRLSCIYALLDRCPVVALRHLSAALAIWKYCEDSARFIFGDSLGDATADRLLSALRANDAGISREQITTAIFAGNKKAAEIDRALSVLIQHGLAYSREEQETGGRPRQRWFASGVN